MDFKITYSNLDSALNAQKMFQLRQRAMLSIVGGNFKEARNSQKEFAKIAVSDFETCKTLPNINYTNVPIKMFLGVWFKSLKFRFYKLFTEKSPEEKQLKKLYKTFLKEQKTDPNVGPKKIDIRIPSS